MPREFCLDLIDQCAQRLENTILSERALFALWADFAAQTIEKPEQAFWWLKYKG